jgi:hypothetical protein
MVFLRDISILCLNSLIKVESFLSVRFLRVEYINVVEFRTYQRSTTRKNRNSSIIVQKEEIYLPICNSVKDEKYFDSLFNLL